MVVNFLRQALEVGDLYVYSILLFCSQRRFTMLSTQIASALRPSMRMKRKNLASQ